MKGLIFDIKRYAIHDGPGIRLTVFFKGCPLSCWWCHNPESRSPRPERLIKTVRIGEKEFQREETVGRQYSVSEVMELVERERIFMEQSGGGVTFSGGEPLMQAPFLLALLQACQEQGIHTAVDTSGIASRAAFRRIIPYTDLFLFDLKHLNDQKHRLYTGASNRLILENFRMIADSGVDIWARVPVIPGYNDEEEQLERLHRFLRENRRDNIRQLNLLPYHPIDAKYGRCGIEWKMGQLEPPSRERMATLQQFFADTGIKALIGG
ncbi:MAG: glycyl-radical enzyme activating protein [Phaeodactylibacter sp.]|nr:glycyl-radical enzyme activating protein [Phaeodactylibacter sp.]MCB9049652.1 glycyl-radical enzyme activating protein [Lewinellaceae bacterium]